MLRVLSALLICLAPAAQACSIALVLAVDVSGSVDDEEYRTQMQGLANAVRDGVVSEALVTGQAQLSVVQWTGSSRQYVSVPWMQIQSFADAEEFASIVETTPRRWRNFSTAIGDALAFARDQFDLIAPCEKHVIDVSGDGQSNEGVAPRGVHPAMKAAGITVNALVIEGVEEDMTAYFWENVIYGPDAFVITANSFDEYPERMRRKLLREVVQQVSFREILKRNGNL